jgi:hypothetical protein
MCSYGKLVDANAPCFVKNHKRIRLNFFYPLTEQDKKFNTLFSKRMIKKRKDGKLFFFCSYGRFLSNTIVMAKQTTMATIMPAMAGTKY